MSNIFKIRFSQAKGNLEEKMKKMTGSSLALKRKCKTRKSQSQGKRLEGEVYFHRGEATEEILECLKSGLDIFLKRSIQTSVVNSHTVTYKPIALADNPLI